MAKKRPEQRSTAGEPPPSGVLPQPTGDEVFKTSNAAPKDQPPAVLPTDIGEAEELQATAAEYFGRLSETAAQLTEQARQVYNTGQDFTRDHPGSTLLGAFAVGLVLGLLTGRD